MTVVPKAAVPPGRQPASAVASGKALVASGRGLSALVVEPTRRRNRPAWQLKSSIGGSGDACEREADAVADAIISNHETPSAPHPDASPVSPFVPGFRSDVKAAHKPIEDEEDVREKDPIALEKCDCDERTNDDVQRAVAHDAGTVGATATELEPRIEVGITAMRGNGHPLPSSERSFMEDRFGFDFGAIRIHTSAEADAHSRALDARAFTAGRDVFFRAGEYTPGRLEGRRLLAHELTHTIQQGAVSRTAGGSQRVGARTVATVQRQPTPAPAPAPAAPVGRATINWLPIVHDQVPTGWGVTKNEDPVFDITAYASGATWKCVITKADQQSRQGVRLLPGVTEVTGALVAAEADCGKLKTMITSLNTVASQGAHSGYYMLAAVQAHEDVHITQYRAGLAPHYTTLKTAIEALTVPHAAHPDAAAAAAAIKALPAYTTAMATFHAADVKVNNDSGKHTPAAPFNTAEHGVVDPMITTIKARRTTLKCAP